MLKREAMTVRIKPDNLIIHPDDWKVIQQGLNDKLKEINGIVNMTGVTRKVKRTILKHEFGLLESQVNELLPNEDDGDY